VVIGKVTQDFTLKFEGTLTVCTLFERMESQGVDDGVHSYFRSEQNKPRTETSAESSRT